MSDAHLCCVEFCLALELSGPDISSELPTSLQHAVKSLQWVPSPKPGQRHRECFRKESRWRAGPSNCLLEHLNTDTSLKQPHFALLGVPW